MVPTKMSWRAVCLRVCVRGQCDLVIAQYLFSVHLLGVVVFGGGSFNL